MPSKRDKESNTSESSDVRGNAFYDIAIQRAKAEERINRWREERTLQGRGQQDGSAMGDELDGDGLRVEEGGTHKKEVVEEECTKEEEESERRKR